MIKVTNLKNQLYVVPMNDKSTLRIPPRTKHAAAILVSDENATSCALTDLVNAGNILIEVLQNTPPKEIPIETKESPLPTEPVAIPIDEERPSPSKRKQRGQYETNGEKGEL